MLDNIFRIYCRGTKILQINTYEIQIQAEFIHVFLLTHICRYLYFITFNLKNRHFCPPKCPRDKKGQKNTSLECLGHKRGTKLIFWTLLIIIVKSFYFIAVQYVSLRLLLKIINLYKIRQYIDYQCIN